MEAHFRRQKEGSYVYGGCVHFSFVWTDKWKDEAHHSYVHEIQNYAKACRYPYGEPN